MYPRAGSARPIVKAALTDGAMVVQTFVPNPSSSGPLNNELKNQLRLSIRMRRYQDSRRCILRPVFHPNSSPIIYCLDKTPSIKCPIPGRGDSRSGLTIGQDQKAI